MPYLLYLVALLGCVVAVCVLSYSLAVPLVGLLSVIVGVFWSSLLAFLHNALGAHWLSGRVLDLSLTGVTALWSLSKAHLSKLSTGSTQEEQSLYN